MAVKSWALASFPPVLVTEPHKPKKFHLAPPEVLGLAVMTLTPFFAKSAHPLIPLGLPSRVTRAATDLLTIALSGASFSQPG